MVNGLPHSALSISHSSLTIRNAHTEWKSKGNAELYGGRNGSVKHLNTTLLSVFLHVEGQRQQRYKCHQGEEAGEVGKDEVVFEQAEPVEQVRPIVFTAFEQVQALHTHIGGVDADVQEILAEPQQRHLHAQPRVVLPEMENQRRRQQDLHQRAACRV